jgi:beta-glucanase (GH16 family)
MFPISLSIQKLDTFKLFSRLRIVLLFLMLASIANAAPPAGYKLAWADEFNGTSLDTNKWDYRLPGKRNDALNVTNAVSVGNGCLTITTYAEGGKHYTGMISTQGKFEPVCGYWEARICFNDSPGSWSAFWLQSPTMGRPVDDPAKAGVEMDICEHRSVDNNGKDIASKVQHTLHWNGYGKFHKSSGLLTPDLKLASGFHVYGFEWTPSACRFYVDGQQTWTINEPISNAREFAILSSEVKDGGWAGNIPGGDYGDLAGSKTKMMVDYVRYYSRQ